MDIDTAVTQIRQIVAESTGRALGLAEDQDRLRAILEAVACTGSNEPGQVPEAVQPGGGEKRESLTESLNALYEAGGKAWEREPDAPACEPAGEGRELPDSPGLWFRSSDEFAYIEHQSDGMSLSIGAIKEADRSYVSLPTWHAWGVDTLPRGGWHKATAPASETTTAKATISHPLSDLVFRRVKPQLTQEQAVSVAAVLLENYDQYREREAQLKSRLASVCGALADAATVPVNVGDPGESVRALTAERDMLREQRDDARRDLAVALRWITAAERIGKAAGYEHAELEASPEYFADRVVEIVAGLREQYRALWCAIWCCPLDEFEDDHEGALAEASRQAKAEVVLKSSRELEQETAALREQLAEARKQLNTVHQHVKEALELLGVDVSLSGYIPDSWTLREQCHAKHLTARDDELRRLRDLLNTLRPSFYAMARCSDSECDRQHGEESLAMIDAALASQPPPRTITTEQ